MRIFHYRKTDYTDNPWQDCLITGDTQLDAYKSRAIITIKGQNILRQHSSTYITGRETCLAHHFAKMLAAAVLSGGYDHASGMSVNLPQSTQGRVLWIDTVRGLHSCADFFNEMLSKFDTGHKRFSMLCLDQLGNFRYDFYAVLGQIEQAIESTKPSLIVIDDIDHLMPYCGINVADAFTHVIRDALNHSEAACLFIGYNHLGKRASTTGNLGKFLFTAADSIFSVTTQQGISKVRLVKSFCIESNRDAEFLFSVEDDNLPHEVIKTMAEPVESNIMKHNTLRDIIGDVIEPGQHISPDELFNKLNERRLQLNRFNRTRALIAQAAQLGIIHKVPDSNDYTLPTAKFQSGPPCPNTVADPQEVFQAGSPCRGTATAPSPKESDSSQVTVNNSLTLPPHPSANKLSSFTGCQPVKKSLHPANGPSSITGCQPVKVTPATFP